MKTTTADRDTIQNHDTAWVDAREPELPGRLAFGPFVLDLAERTLLRDGRRCAIQPQPLRVLALLAARPRRVTTREALRREIWGDDFAVDYEHGLNFAIHQIRGVLGDSAKRPLYVETVPRVGYRFIADVDRLESPPDRVASIDAEPSRGTLGLAPAERSRSRQALPVAGLALVVGMALLAGIWARSGGLGGDRRRRSSRRP